MVEAGEGVVVAVGVTVLPTALVPVPVVPFPAARGLASTSGVPVFAPAVAVPVGGFVPVSNLETVALLPVAGVAPVSLDFAGAVRLLVPVGVSLLI